ncbi:MAG: type II secretion system F family protein [Actinomycetota bacterium]
MLALSYVLALGMLLVAAVGATDPRLRRLLGAGATSSVRSLPAPLEGRVPFPRIGASMLRPFRSKAERLRVEAAVPDLFDLLAVSVTAGLSPRLALERAPETVRGRLGEILAAVRGDVSLGAPWHGALEAAGKQAGVADLRRLAVTLDRAERLGSPISERLKDLATEVRNERRVRREERARRAPVQMLFPLVFLILPAFVLAAVVPALIVATRDIV